MSNQYLSEGLIGVLPWGLPKGLCGVVSRIVCTMDLAKSSSRAQSHFGKLLKGLESSIPRCTVFVKDFSGVRLVDGWQVRGIENGANLRGLGIYAQNQ